LKNFLPIQLQDAGITTRVLSSGYDSNMVFSKAVTDIDDVAGMLFDRLVGERQKRDQEASFIAHSLGGIVVKKVRRVFPNYPRSWSSPTPYAHNAYKS
jgi:hypothetical protein